jgi:spermidine synthase
VEIDGEIVKVGREYFGMPEYGEDKRFRVLVDDGLEFLKNTRKPLCSTV